MLAYAFPIGNPIGEIIMAGDPYFRRALGRRGPRSTVGLAAEGQIWQIPKPWDYGHLDYLPGSSGRRAVHAAAARAHEQRPSAAYKPWLEERVVGGRDRDAV